MKSLSIALFLTLAFAGSTLGQTFSGIVAKVRPIKLLESTRDDVKRILHDYDSSDDVGHHQRFSNDALTIIVEYSSGACTEDPNEEDASEIWNVKEWTVTRIEVDLDESISLRSAGPNLSTFKKESRYPETDDSFVFHSKAAGFALKTYEDEIERLIFFPPRASSNKLCRIASAAKGFYIRKGWFSQARPYDYACVLLNLPANVQEMNLNASEIDAGSNTTISVATVAIDPENDVLTYNYKVSAGRIIGQGSSVEWDLTGVSAGTYSITVGVDDGVGVVGKTVTKTVVVK
jgi:hypothetical protein